MTSFRVGTLRHTPTGQCFSVRLEPEYGEARPVSAKAKVRFTDPVTYDKLTPAHIGALTGHGIYLIEKKINGRWRPWSVGQTGSFRTRTYKHVEGSRRGGADLDRMRIRFGRISGASPQRRREMVEAITSRAWQNRTRRTLLGDRRNLKTRTIGPAGASVRYSGAVPNRLRSPVRLRRGTSYEHEFG
jgi:hypothetical protein